MIGIHDLIKYVKIPLIILIGLIMYVFIFKNEPLMDEASRTIQNSTEYTTEKKMADPSLFLYSVSQKIQTAIENQHSAAYELQKSGELLNSKLRSSIARSEWIKKKLSGAKVEFLTLERKFAIDPNAFDVQVDMASKRGEITSLLLEQEAVVNNISRTKKQLTMNIERSQVAGLKAIQLESDLSLVKSTDDLAKVLNPANGVGLSSSGASEITDLLADVSTLSRYLQGQTDEYLARDFAVGSYTDTDKIFEEFMNMGSEKNADQQDLSDVTSNLSQEISAETSLNKEVGAEIDIQSS